MALAASENTTAIAQLKAEQGQMDQTASRNAKPFVDLKMGQEKIARAVASERRSARRRSGRANRLALPRDSIEPHESQAKMVVEPAIRSQPPFAPRVPAPLL